MIRFTFYYGAGPIELLGEYQANHLMGERHQRERDLLVGPLVYALGKAVWASYYEDEASGGVAFALEPRRKLHAAVLFAVLVEQYHGVRWRELLHYQLALGLFLLLFRYVFGVLHLGYRDNLKRHIVAYTLGVVADTGREVLVDCSSNENEQRLHLLRVFVFALGIHREPTLQHTLPLVEKLADGPEERCSDDSEYG